MNSRERVLAMLEGRAVDRLPLMPITMMFAADQIRVKYGPYAADFRVLVQAQMATAEKFDLDYVSCISDPGREAADCGATVHFFEDQPPAIDELKARLADKKALASLSVPDPLGGGRMQDRVQAAALFKQRVGSDKLIEGWIEGPCAEAADLRGINNLMTDFYDDPGFVRDLFEFVLVLELLIGNCFLGAPHLLGVARVRENWFFAPCIMTGWSQSTGCLSSGEFSRCFPVLGSSGAFLAPRVWRRWSRKWRPSRQPSRWVWQFSRRCGTAAGQNPSVQPRVLSQRRSVGQDVFVVRPVCAALLGLPARQAGMGSTSSQGS